MAFLLTTLVQLLTSHHLCHVYIQHTGIPLRYPCAELAHGIPLLHWHERYGHFKRGIDSQSDDVKLTILQTLVTGRAKTAIAEFAYCGAIYKHALKTTESKCGQPQVVVSALLHKLNSFPPLKMHNSDKIINFLGCISSFVVVFKSFSYDADLKSAGLLNTSVQKLPPKMKYSMSLFTVKKHWMKPTLLDFNDWLKDKDKAHNLRKNTAIKTKTEDTINLVTKSEVALKAFAAKTQQKFLKNRNRSLCQHLSHSASYARTAIGCESVACLRKVFHAASQGRGWSKALFLLIAW